MTATDASRPVELRLEGHVKQSIFAQSDDARQEEAVVTAIGRKESARARKPTQIGARGVQLVRRAEHLCDDAHTHHHNAERSISCPVCCAGARDASNGHNRIFGSDGTCEK